MDHHTTLKEVYDNKIFHGKKTKAEAYELCKEELENTAKEFVFIWFLEEKDGKLRSRRAYLDRLGYRKDSNVPMVPTLGGNLTNIAQCSRMHL